MSDNCFFHLSPGEYLLRSRRSLAVASARGVLTAARCAHLSVARRDHRPARPGGVAARSGASRPCRSAARCSERHLEFRPPRQRGRAVLGEWVCVVSVTQFANVARTQQCAPLSSQATTPPTATTTNSSTQSPARVLFLVLFVVVCCCC